MFGSTVLEVAVGMTFCFAAVGLLVSTLQEALASSLRLRARALLAGVKTMLNDPHFTGLARTLYRHALVNPHDDGSAPSEHTYQSKPSYIAPAQFAVALVDSISSMPGDFAQLGRDLDAMDDLQLRRTLLGMYVRADGQLARFEQSVALWFESAMERVSATYKRRAQLSCVALALLLAIVFNIDTIYLFRSLWLHPVLSAQLGAAAPALDRPTLDAVAALPLGWRAFPPAFDLQLLLSVAGWTLTALTALFGAPFWFDLFQRAVLLRGPPRKNLVRRVPPGG